MLFLCADGGGTKLQIAAFDENYRLLASLKAPAVGTLYIPRETVTANTRDAFSRFASELPADLPRDNDGKIVAEAFLATDFSFSLLTQALRAVFSPRREIALREGVCGLLAGAGTKTGYLALSGTGSDCFAIRDGVQVGFLGGFGPVLGDEGSGYDLGRQALRAAIYADEGRGEDTMLRDLIFEEYGLREKMFELVDIVYRSEDTRKPVARATYPLAKAARAGDAAALRILTEGGRSLAHDLCCLLRRSGETEDSTAAATVSGGAWKIHPLLYQTFSSAVLARYPRLRLTAPWFDPVMAGLIYVVLEREGSVTPERLNALKREFSQFVLDPYFPKTI